MHTLNKYQTVVILFSALLGIALGHVAIIQTYSAQLIIPLLMMMLFGLFLSMDFRALKSSFLQMRFSVTNLLINFLWTPAIAYGIGHLFLADDLALWVGFVMLLVTPCTDWYLVFTGVAKGNVPLAASVLPVNLILQVLLLPIYLMLFFGKSAHLEWTPLLESILLVLVIPFALAWSIKKLFSGREKPNSLVSFFEQGQMLFLALAVVAMFASEGKNLNQNPEVIYALFVPILLFFFIAFLLAQLISKLLKFRYADRVSLTMTTMARNSPIALALAVSAFSSEPWIALALIIGPLLELPILVLTAQILLKTQPEPTDAHTGSQDR